MHPVEENLRYLLALSGTNRQHRRAAAPHPHSAHPATGATLAAMSTFKERVQHDLHDAMRARDQVRSATLRMVLTAITTQEVAGEHARDLSEEEVRAVVVKEAKKRREAAQAYDSAGRGELAATERAELAVLEEYLPAQLGDVELKQLVDAAIAQTGATGMAQMGQVMKVVQAQVAGRAEGGRVASLVKAALSR